MTKVADSVQLLILPIEKEEALLERVTAEDRARAASFRSADRRCEYLTWRAALYGLLGRTCPPLYSAVGAPLLPEGWGWIGVSHSRNRIALIYSPTGPVAVDIESEDRRFEAVADRYLTPEERALSDHEAWLGIAWSAKETLYKISHRKELDLKKELHLHRVEWLSATVSTKEKITPAGVIHGSVGETPYRLGFAPIEEAWVVWSL